MATSRTAARYTSGLIALGFRFFPIIGVSAHAMAGDQEKAIAAGCDDYVTKPIDLRELLQKAEKLINSGGEAKT